MQSPDRKGHRRWWVALGLAVGLCVVGVVLWHVRQAGTPRPAKSMSALPPQPLSKTNPGVVPLVAEAPKPGVPAAEPPQTPPVKTQAGAPPRQATGNAPASSDHSDAMAVTRSAQPETRPLSTAVPTAASRVQPTPSQQANLVRQNPAPTPIPEAAPNEDPAPRPVETAATRQPAARRDTDRPFRSDPRIDLQALVWAPEPTGRFVVINNRLIKEGGSVDNIVVVRINPDDVLLAEGSDRWHETFKIR
ncbi:general secretion pathway protein GspB [Desulfosarcina sp.]|uniref:general secretion pathway protein GspB n=1 Tax=Desulfosarcina sp. TaxID=2027861 RepID=UPI00356267EF